MSKFIWKLLLSIMKSSLSVLFMGIIFSFGSFVLLGLDWDKIIVFLLAILFTLIFCVLIFILGRSLGETEHKNKKLNDTRRKVGEKGVDYYTKREKEFLPYKGFLIGLCSALPIIIMLIIRIFTGANVGLEAAIKLIYSVFTTPLLVLNNSVNIFIFSYVFILHSVVFGLGYIVGGNKIKKQQNIIRQELESIYGEEIDV